MYLIFSRKIQLQSDGRRTKLTDNLKIPFSGVPYILLAKRRYQFHQGEDTHKESKENYQAKRKEQQTSDHCFIRSKKLSQPTKKLDCPLVFTVKKLLPFPEYKVKKNTQRKGTKMAAKLKKEITALSSAKNDLERFTKDEENKNSIKPLGRLEYICKFPDPNGHENHHVGEAATISEPLDERVVEFLKDKK